MRNEHLDEAKKWISSRYHIRLRGCPNEGPCYCTGACRLPKEDIAAPSTRKIADFTPQERCMNPSHKPPMHRVYSPGIWEHTCPGCGEVTTFTVPLITY